MDTETDDFDLHHDANNRRRRVRLSCVALLACVLMLADLTWQAGNGGSDTPIRNRTCCTADRHIDRSAINAFKSETPTLLFGEPDS